MNNDTLDTVSLMSRTSPTSVVSARDFRLTVGRLILAQARGKRLDRSNQASTSPTCQVRWNHLLAGTYWIPELECGKKFTSFSNYPLHNSASQPFYTERPFFPPTFKLWTTTILHAISQCHRSVTVFIPLIALNTTLTVQPRSTRSRTAGVQAWNR